MNAFFIHNISSSAHTSTLPAQLHVHVYPRLTTSNNLNPNLNHDTRQRKRHRRHWQHQMASPHATDIGSDNGGNWDSESRRRFIQGMFILSQISYQTNNYYRQTHANGTCQSTVNTTTIPGTMSRGSPRHPYHSTMQRPPLHHTTAKTVTTLATPLEKRRFLFILTVLVTERNMI